MLFYFKNYPKVKIDIEIKFSNKNTSYSKTEASTGNNNNNPNDNIKNIKSESNDIVKLSNDLSIQNNLSIIEIL